MKFFCSICLEFFTYKCSVWFTVCGHVYHEECIQKWCKEKDTCPQCRCPLLKNLKKLQLNFINDLRDSTDISTTHSCGGWMLKYIREQQNKLSEKNYELEKAVNDLKREVSDTKRLLKFSIETEIQQDGISIPVRESSSNSRLFHQQNCRKEGILITETDFELSNRQKAGKVESRKCKTRTHSVLHYACCSMKHKQRKTKQDPEYDQLWKEILEGLEKTNENNDA